MPTTSTSPTSDHRPNHHADHPGFRGVGALLAATSFLVGRADDARLACELTAVGAGDHWSMSGAGPGSPPVRPPAAAPA